MEEKNTNPAQRRKSPEEMFGDISFESADKREQTLSEEQPAAEKPAESQPVRRAHRAVRSVSMPAAHSAAEEPSAEKPAAKPDAIQPKAEPEKAEEVPASEPVETESGEPTAEAVPSESPEAVSEPVETEAREVRQLAAEAAQSEPSSDKAEEDSAADREKAEPEDYFADYELPVFNFDALHAKETQPEKTTQIPVVPTPKPAEPVVPKAEEEPQPAPAEPAMERTYAFPLTPDAPTAPEADPATTDTVITDAVGKDDLEVLRSSGKKKKADPECDGSKPEDGKKKTKKERRDRTTLPSLLKAVIYIVSVLVVSVFLSYFVISVGNDVFAFSKPRMVCTVDIVDHMTLADTAELLADNGMIEHPLMFRLYVKIKDIKMDFVPGTYEINSQMNYEDFIDTFNCFHHGAAREQVVVTVPEGYTVDDIISLLVSKGIGERSKYVDVIQNYEFDYDFIKALPDPLPQGRTYRLEGYLFPDTYYVFKDAAEADVINKFLQNTEIKLTDARYERAAELGYSMDEIITLGSIIQAEGRFLAEFENISSVFHNRLNNPTLFPLLQSDATIQYVLPEHTVDLTQDDLNLDNRYNTYLYEGLPPGAICNPGLNAIDAALYPEQTDYFYFVADRQGNSVFSRTKEEHDAAVAKIKEEKELLS